jgi:phosphate transport system protein
MSVHLQRAIENLKKQLLSLCALVEDQVQMGVRALLERDETLAAKVQRGDREIDDREVYLEEECLKVLALYQPVAIDLRLVVAALKINNDLERIGDLAVNIARKAIAFAHEPFMEIPIDIGGMWERTQAMLRDSLDALVQVDARLAYQVCSRDNEIDGMKHEFRVEIEDRICREPELAHALLRLLAVTRNLERIADCATNIAEDVIYLIEGKIVRHEKQE